VNCKLQHETVIDVSFDAMATRAMRLRLRTL